MTEDPMNREDLIRRAQDGDEWAADQLAADPTALSLVLSSLEQARPVGLLDTVVIRAGRYGAAAGLIDGLASSSYDVVRACTLALGRARDSSALEPLLVVLSETDRTQTERSFAAAALGDLGDLAAVGPLHAVVDATRPDLEGDDWPVLLIRSAVALAKLGDHTEVEAVTAALASNLETTRSLGANALRIVTGPGVVPALKSKIHDRSREVRLALIEPLFLLGTSEAVEALIPICQDEVGDIALRALLRLGDLLGEAFTEDDGEEEAREAWHRHRASFRPGSCHRWGHPLRVLELVDAWETDPNRRDDIAGELTVVTGLPIADLLRAYGTEPLRERLAADAYVDGGLYKWGHRILVDGASDVSTPL